MTCLDVWASGQHLGANRPQQLAQVRGGRYRRRYDDWDSDGYPVDADIAGHPSDTPWQSFWTPGYYVGEGDDAVFVEDDTWYDLPNVVRDERSKNYDANGIETATITVENVVSVDEEAGGHSFARGYMSPLRGYVAEGREALYDELGRLVGENEWSRKIEQAQIVIYEGYGSGCLKKKFIGLVDDVDVTSKPDIATITARSHGKMLTDADMFGWNKDGHSDALDLTTMRDPVIFVSRDDADGIKRVGYDESASSERDDDSLATFGADGDQDTAWRSQDHDGPDVTEWLEIKLRKGRYSDYYLHPAYDDMELYVSLYAVNRVAPNGDETAPTRDGVDIDEGWVDVGNGDVPGAFGGVPWLTHITPLDVAGAVHDLDAEYIVGADSILRFSFRDLREASPGEWRAGVRESWARKRKIVPDAIRQHWVLVDDVSDIVKVVLRWAGFKEWEVESSGVKLGHRYLVDRHAFYIDVINAVKEIVGYTFFIADPTENDLSLGVPVFRKTFALTNPETLGSGDPIPTITDQTLLTGISVKESDEGLPYNIRVRGRKDKDEGTPLGADRTHRLMYYFRPPFFFRLNGILRHLIHTIPLIKTLNGCKFAAYYIALQAALENIKASISIPAHPSVDLDDHVILEDLGTGVTTRLAVSERNTTFEAGEKATYTQTLSGALIDTPDIQAMVTIINNAVADSA